MMKKGALALCFLVNTSVVPSGKITSWGAPDNLPRAPLQFSSCPEELPPINDLVTRHPLYDEPDAAQTVWCMVHAVEQSPEGRENIHSTREYLQALGVTDTEWAMLAPYIPTEFHFVEQDLEQAFSYVTGIGYLNSVENRWPFNSSFMRLRTIIAGSNNGYYVLDLPQNDGTLRDDGYILAPPISDGPFFMYGAEFWRPHMQETSYQRDMRLLITFHEMGHPIVRTQTRALDGTHHHAEAAPDILALTFLSALRGGITPAMRDYVAWRKISAFNTILSWPNPRYISHATGPIVSSYLSFMESRNNFSPETINDVIDINRLTRETYMFRQNPDDEITDSNLEAAHLLQDILTQNASLRERYRSAQILLDEIEAGNIEIRYRSTRSVLESYIDGMRVWMPPIGYVSTQPRPPPQQTADLVQLLVNPR